MTNPDNDNQPSTESVEEKSRAARLQSAISGLRLGVRYGNNKLLENARLELLSLGVSEGEIDILERGDAHR